MDNCICLKTRLSIIAVTIILAALLGMSLPHVVKSAEKEIAVIGASRIYDNVTSARNAAIAEGLLSAVEWVALDMIPREKLKADFDIISAGLYEHRLDFTQGYQVLKEINTGDYYRLLIRTTVSVDKIQSVLQDLGVTMTPEAMPKTLFLVAEKHADDLSYDFWWRAGAVRPEQSSAIQPMKQVFRKKGFPILEAQELPKQKIISDTELSEDLTAADAVMLGQRAGADIVVYGKARTKETPNKMGGDIKTFKGSVSLAAVDVAAEKVIASVDEMETAANRNIEEGSRYALSNAGYRAGKILAEQISEAWQKQAEQSDAIEVHINGKGDILPQLVKFRKMMRQVQGVSALQTVERSRSKALMTMKYDGNPRGLADKILLTGFDGFGVNIYEMTGNRIHIEFLDHSAITESELN